MIWLMVIAAAAAAVGFVVIIAFSRRRAVDLGAVSGRWIEEHSMNVH